MSHVAPLRVGPFEIVVVCQGSAPLDLADECPGHEVDWRLERALHPWAFGDDGSWPWHVHAFAVRGPGGLAMVDTGLGSYPPYRPWGPDPGVSATEAYDEAGVEVAEVRVVVLSHLHADHAGGSWGAEGPRFPEAKYVLHEADVDFFSATPDADAYSALAELRRIEALGMLDADPDDREVMAGLRIVHTPGHTPGHRSVVLDAGDERVLLTGDLLHLPVQAAHPSWPSSHDDDADTGAASRTSVLAMAAKSGWHVGVQHFASPFGHIDDRGWRSAGSVEDPTRDGRAGRT